MEWGGGQGGVSEVRKGDAGAGGERTRGKRGQTDIPSEDIIRHSRNTVFISKCQTEFEHQSRFSRSDWSAEIFDEKKVSSALLISFFFFFLICNF